MTNRKQPTKGENHGKEKSESCRPQRQSYQTEEEIKLQAPSGLRNRLRSASFAISKTWVVNDNEKRR